MRGIFLRKSVALVRDREASIHARGELQVVPLVIELLLHRDLFDDARNAIGVAVVVAAMNKAILRMCRSLPDWSAFAEPSAGLVLGFGSL
jgi:hypothetical protein